MAELTEAEIRAELLRSGDTPLPMSERVCRTCYYWLRISRYIGQCRCHAPVRSAEGVGVCPVTAEEFWCGEYESRDRQWGR